jgi:DNA-binding response OmpR family regulator
LIPSCPVLLVEDDETFRRPLVAALDQSHFAVALAGDGQEAIDLLRDRDFQVIILDLKMPNVSGLEVLKYIADNRERIDAKVLVLTGASAEERAKVDVTVAEEVMMKPVDFTHVVKRARRYCGHTDD